MAVSIRPFFPLRVVRDFATLFLVPAEDHLAGSCLEHAGHGRLNGLSDHLSGVVNNDHCAVIEVGYALIEFLALLQDEDFHRFTR